jgi:hypothetical protein
MHTRWQWGIRELARICSVFVMVAGGARSGVLVTRDSHGLRFAEAISITVNGKDKVLNAGPDARLYAGAGKLPWLKLEEATVLKDKGTGALVVVDGNELTYTLPEGVGKNAPAAFATAWSGVTIGYKRTKSDKSPGEIPAADFVAFLPGGVPEVVSLCTNRQLLEAVGGAGNAFNTQLEWTGDVVKAYGTAPEAAPLQKSVERAMRTRFEQFESGSGTVAVLDEALKLAELSAAIYPNVPEQVALRQQIAKTKRWLDRRVAVLRAFAAGDEWDQYLLADRDFDRYEPAFPTLMQLRVKALNASLEFHRDRGEEFFSNKEYEAAYREFRMASLRKPSDTLLSQRVLMSWSDYSREVATDNQGNRKRLGEGEREVLNRAIQFASSYKEENKLDLALKSIQEAEAIDPDSLPMLLKKAEILGAQRSFSQAFAALDHYDLLAVDEEREKSSNLRNELLFKQKSSLEDIKEQIQKAWAEGRYHKLYDLALEGLAAKDDDGDLLYQAAIASLIVRQPDRASGFLSQYLQVTNTLDADPQQRARARSVLANIKGTRGAETGQPSWLSGRKLPADVYYDPISLAFQPKIDHIDASNKMHVGYEWNGDKLLSIVPSFEKAEKATGERPISFIYNEAFAQVLIASDTAHPATPATTDPDDLLKQSSLIVLNNPYIDPDAVEKLTGKSVALGISGNRYFEPFVWDRVHYFRLKYDYAGRVMEAVELSDRNGAPTNRTVEFDWDGLQLTAVRGYEGPDKAHRREVYSRTLQYEGGRLVSEDIESDGKSSHIKYNYNDGRLVSANCSTDATLDNRSRQVFFR